MAISRPKYPAVMVAGKVTGILERNRFVDNKRTDEIERYDVSIETDGGGQLDVRFPVNRDGSTEVPAMLANVGVIVEIRETREWGAHLRFSRHVTADDLDRIASSMLVSAGK